MRRDILLTHRHASSDRDRVPIGMSPNKLEALMIVDCPSSGIEHSLHIVPSSINKQRPRQLHFATLTTLAVLHPGATANMP